MDCLTKLFQAIHAGRPAALLTLADSASPDRLGRRLLVDHGAIAAAETTLTVTSLEPVADMIRAGKAGLTRIQGIRVFVEPFLPPLTLVVVGAGHVAQPLAELGKRIGYRVVVVDDRAAYANTGRFPAADRIICDEFTPALEGLELGPHHSVVLVTRGHRHDMECLRVLLPEPLAYLGMIGSRTRVQAVFRLLQEEAGMDPALFDRVYAPIGLDVGARTPAEIAVSVVAELLKVRSGGTGESLSRTGRASVHRSAPHRGESEVLGAALEAGGEAALATVIHTRGHCPREAGAKMLIRRDGTTCGTIGGGCGEAEVRQKALSVLDDGRAVLHITDLMDDPALVDGAVCGGKMEILIQPV